MGPSGPLDQVCVRGFDDPSWSFSVFWISMVMIKSAGACRNVSTDTSPHKLVKSKKSGFMYMMNLGVF